MAEKHLHVAFMGTRGVPARYGGFETAVEEIGKRLVERGHDVTVYRRAGTDDGHRPTSHLGMRLVTLPALRAKALETLSHTTLSALHHRARRSTDVLFLFNAANAPLIPLALRRRPRLPIAVHVDGLEWQRSKWAASGRQWYLRSEALAVRWADALIADAPGIAAYYDRSFGATTEQIAYGAPILTDPGAERVRAQGLEPDGYHLLVARFEPENNVDLIVSGYRASAARLPLVAVGSAPYRSDHTKRIEAVAEEDPRIRLVGPVWDQDLLDELYANARVYLHGHTVGGTNPSLLRAMGAGAAVGAYAVCFNHDVTGDEAWSFRTTQDVAAIVERAERSPEDCRALGRSLQVRVAERYRWEEVADAYEDLAQRLAAGHTRRGEVSGRRLEPPPVPGSARPDRPA